MIKRGDLAIISGFSGVGKGTVIAKLLEAHDDYVLSVSVTTRAPRENETDGVHYHFISQEAFEEMRSKQELLESADFCDHSYGTPRPFVENNLAQGRNVLLEIEIKGALKIKQQYPEALMIYILPTSAVQLRNQLAGRQTETEEVIRSRLAKAAQEADEVEQYEYVVVNDQPELCAERIHHLITSRGAGCEAFTTAANADRIREIRRQLKEFQKGE